MLLNELHIVHNMLKEKNLGFKYLNEWIKVLKPDSWRIFHMRNVDQKEWKRIRDTVDPTMSRKEEDLEEYLKIDKIMRLNTRNLKEITDKNGCITISKFGMIASHSAWLIVQHSNHNRQFQRKYLEVMRENKKDVFLENIKSLEKRLGV